MAQRFAFGVTGLVNAPSVGGGVQLRWQGRNFALMASAERRSAFEKTISAGIGTITVPAATSLGGGAEYYFGDGQVKPFIGGFVQANLGLGPGVEAGPTAGVAFRLATRLGATVGFEYAITRATVLNSAIRRDETLSFQQPRVRVSLFYF